MSRDIPLAVALVLLLSSPVALASWGSKGIQEPDVKRDITEGWMFTTADVSISQDVRMVYFNGFHGNGVFFGPDTSNSLNFATLRSSMYYGEGYNFEAVLGVWKDCNKDGYMGLGDQGLLEYRSELLLDTSVCPKQVTPIVPATQLPPLDWFPTHNDGQWVRELLPISWPETNGIIADTNPWNVNDKGARVWADYGVPGTWPLPSLSCWWNPHPRGTWHSTGGLLEYSDCWGGGRITTTFDGVADGNAALRPYSFSDHPTDQHNSASQANIRNPWGVSSDASYVEPWDCNAQQPAQVIVPAIPQANREASYVVNVSQPRVPPGVNANGDMSGTFNSTLSGFSKCERSNSDRTGSNVPYALEGDVVNPTGAKTSPDGTLDPRDDARPEAPFGAVLGKATPSPTGTTAGTHLDGNAGFWSENTQREELFALNSRDEISPVVYNTFYAFVSPKAVRDYGLSLPKGPTTGTYGIEACGSLSSGIQNRWDCDSAHWYLDAFGKNIQPRDYRLGQEPNNAKGCTDTTTAGCVPYGSILRTAYNLRDIDCYDQSVQAARASGVSWGVLTGTACPYTT